MAKDANEYGDIKLKSAVADMQGRRQGHVALVLGKGLFRVTWKDGEQEILDRHSIRARYTTQSVGY
jgi:hypothetical protein